MVKTKGQQVATRNRRVQNNGSISGTTKSFTVKMKELIADVTASTTFDPQQVKINPGLPEVFSWLHQIAGAYEQYRIKKLDFEIMPQCPATATGGSGIYLDYDANDGIVTSKQDFFAMADATVQQIWQEVHIKTRVNNKVYFVRNGSVPDSLLLYDHLSLNYFVESDTTANNVLIFADYEIEFLKP